MSLPATAQDKKHPLANLCAIRERSPPNQRSTGTAFPWVATPDPEQFDDSPVVPYALDNRIVPCSTGAAISPALATFAYMDAKCSAIFWDLKRALKQVATVTPSAPPRARANSPATTPSQRRARHRPSLQVQLLS